MGWTSQHGTEFRFQFKTLLNVLKQHQQGKEKNSKDNHYNECKAGNDSTSQTRDDRNINGDIFKVHEIYSKQTMFEDYISIRNPERHSMDESIWRWYMGEAINSKDVLLGQIAAFFIPFMKISKKKANVYVKSILYNYVKSHSIL